MGFCTKAILLAHIYSSDKRIWYNKTQIRPIQFNTFNICFIIKQKKKKLQSNKS